MSDRPQRAVIRLDFAASQYARFAGLAFGIWLAGVVLVRALPSSSFDTDEPWPVVLFAVSIVLGVVTQWSAPISTGVRAHDALIPIIFVAGVALVLDGIAIGFTEIYSDETDVKVVVAGWLLWTFGTQILISLAMVARLLRIEQPAPG